jgi:hypothetical protein
LRIDLLGPTATIATTFRIWSLVVAFAVCLSAAAVGQGDIRRERVQFQRGTTSAVVEDSITGYAIVDYLLGARAGQYMNVSMATDNTANYFNILAPGETEVAFFNGSVSENQYEGALPDDGDYTVRVYLMRIAARREEHANYRLEMIISADEGASAGTSAAAGDEGENSASARAGRSDFDATGQIPCAQAAGQPMVQCDFGVARAGGGNATVLVTLPDGRKRALFFEQADLLSADVSEADGSGEIAATKEADLNTIRVGDERYEIPDAVLFGG